VLPRGLATRAGAALGIIPFGTTAEAWGASTALGPERVGKMPARTDPSKHGLELSQDVKVLARAAAKRRKASAPRKQISAQTAYTCLRGAPPRPGIGKRQRLSVLRGIGWMRLSALRLPLFAGGESILALWLASLGRVTVPRERFLLSHCEPTGRARSGRPDDRLREAIQGGSRESWIASSLSLLAMTTCGCTLRRWVSCR
jgi:hypothetical protein